MGTFGKIQVTARLSGDFEETQRIFSADPVDQFFIPDTKLTGSGLSGIVVVPNLSTDYAIPLGTLTALKFIFLRSSRLVTVKTAGGGTANKVGFADGSPGMLALIGDGMSTLLISNSSGADAIIRYTVAGS